MRQSVYPKSFIVFARRVRIFSLAFLDTVSELALVVTTVPPFTNPFAFKTALLPLPLKVDHGAVGIEGVSPLAMRLEISIERPYVEKQDTFVSVPISKLDELVVLIFVIQLHILHSRTKLRSQPAQNRLGVLPNSLKCELNVSALVDQFTFAMSHTFVKLALVSFFPVEESEQTKSTGESIAKAALVALVLGHVEYAMPVGLPVDKPAEVIFVEILMFVLLDIICFNVFHSLAPEFDVQQIIVLMIQILHNRVRRKRLLIGAKIATHPASTHRYTLFQQYGSLKNQIQYLHAPLCVFLLITQGCSI